MNNRLTLLVIRNQVETFGGPGTGTEYDLSSACRACGTGATQTGPLRLRVRKPPKHDIWLTLDHEVVVSTRLAEALLAAGFDCLTQVVTSRALSPLPLWQLRPQATLPPFSPATSGVVRERPCPTCRRDGHFGIPHVPVGLVYSDSSQISQECDLFATFERFGNSRLREPFRESVFAAPLYVVTDRLVACLQHARPRGLEFDAVTLGDVPSDSSSQRATPGHSPGY